MRLNEVGTYLHLGDIDGRINNHYGSPPKRGATWMITRIREVRRARNMTLEEVALRCFPPTTPQTIGRLETGSRTVSLRWLDRIAGAIGVSASDLVRVPDRDDLEVAAVLGGEGAQAPRRRAVIVPPQTSEGLIAVAVASGIGDYRSGDEIWLNRIGPEDYANALNRDVLVPRPGGRFVFGRLIGREAPDTQGTQGKLQVLPLGTGARQSVFTDPAWIAVAVRMIRSL
jgi:transcriptional regulator with XRE-family HTH domain